VFDVMAIGPTSVRCIQVKAGGARLSRAERAAILAVSCPDSVSREYRRFSDREPVQVRVLEPT